MNWLKYFFDPHFCSVCC